MTTATHRMYKPGQDVTGRAIANLAAGQLLAIAGDRTGGNLTVGPAAAGDHPIGVAGHDAADATLVHIVRGGIVAVLADNGIAAGAPVTTAADGKAKAAADGEPIIGLAVAAAAEGRVYVAL